jgi:hypothetical protein
MKIIVGYLQNKEKFKLSRNQRKDSILKWFNYIIRKDTFNTRY